MGTRWFGLCVFATVLWGLSSMSSLALAQDGAEEGQVTSYDFEDDLVTGDLVRPDGEMLVVRRGGRRSSLIEIREHFIPEILQSIEDI